MKISVRLLALLLALVLMACVSVSAESEPVELSIYCRYDSTLGIDPDNLWWWTYAESRLAQMGYNVTLNVTGSLNGAELTQGVAMRLGSDSLPDIMWGIGLSGSQAVLYGDTDGIIMDLTPYLDETYLPNAYECSITNGKAAFDASRSPAGKLYGLPYVVDRTLGWIAGTSVASANMWINTEILSDLGYDIPTTGEELLEVLRAAKEYETADGKKIIPMLARDGDMLGQLMLAYFGYYGTTCQYGENAMVKDGEIVLPIYTEEYKEILSFMNTLYSEELIPQQYFTMDAETEKSLAAEGNFLIYCYSQGLPNDAAIFHKYVAVNPINMIKGVKPVLSLSTPYSVNTVWVSAKTQHIEEVCALLDLLYEDEALALAILGPVVKDPLGIYEYAWQPNEDGTDLVHPLIGSGKQYASTNDHQYNNIAPNNAVGDQSNYTYYSKAVMAGLDFSLKYEQYTDCITGETITVTDKSGYREKMATLWDAYSRIQRYEAWINNLTGVMLSVLYCNEEDSQRMTDLSSVIKAYAQENYAQFITGLRDLDTFDAYQEELKAMGADELVDIYTRGYASYMASIFD